MTRIVTTSYRYKRPPRKRKAVAVEGPAALARMPKHLRRRAGTAGNVRIADPPRHALPLPAERLAEMPFVYSPRDGRLIAPWSTHNAMLCVLNLAGTNHAGADLSGAYFEGAHLSMAHLEGVDLGGTHLERADLSGAQLEGADLGGAYLEGADLSGVHLGGANLSGAIGDANLSGAHLESADLSGAHFEGAVFRAAHLEGADLSGTIGDAKTRLPAGVARPAHWPPYAP